MLIIENYSFFVLFHSIKSQNKNVFCNLFIADYQISEAQRCQTTNLSILFTSTFIFLYHINYSKLCEKWAVCLLLRRQNLPVKFRDIRWWGAYPSYSWRRRKAVRKHVSNLTPSKTDGPKIWLNYDTAVHTRGV